MSAAAAASLAIPRSRHRCPHRLPWSASLYTPVSGWAYHTRFLPLRLKSRLFRPSSCSRRPGAATALVARRILSLSASLGHSRHLRRRARATSCVSTAVTLLQSVTRSMVPA